MSQTHLPVVKKVLLSPMDASFTNQLFHPCKHGIATIKAAPNKNSI